MHLRFTRCFEIPSRDDPDYYDRDSWHAQWHLVSPESRQVSSTQACLAVHLRRQDTEKPRGSRDGRIDNSQHLGSSCSLAGVVPPARIVYFPIVSEVVESNHANGAGDSAKLGKAHLGRRCCIFFPLLPYNVRRKQDTEQEDPDSSM